MKQMIFFPHVEQQLKKWLTSHQIMIICKFNYEECFVYFGTTPRLHKSKEAYPICVMCVVVHERKVVTKKKAPVSLFLTEIISRRQKNANRKIV